MKIDCTRVKWFTNKREHRTVLKGVLLYSYRARITIVNSRIKKQKKCLKIEC